MKDNQTIKHNYGPMSLYTFLDETAWEYCYILGCSAAGTPTPSPEDWLKVISGIDDGLDDYDKEDKEEIKILLRHVARAERGFALKKRLPGMTDTELMGVLAAGDEKTGDVMAALGKAYEPDNNLDIFLLLTADLSAKDPEKAQERAKTVTRLAKYYFGETAIYNDIMAAYGTCLIYMGKTTKAQAVFDTIFEGDEMNLRSMVAVCNALEQTGEKETFKKYLRKAVETAMLLENEEMLGELTAVYESCFPDDDTEDFNVDLHTLQEIIDMRSPEPEKVIWANIQEMHPRETERLIEQEEPEEILDGLFRHLQLHARLCALIVKKEQPYYDAYKEIYNKFQSEHKRQHELMERFKDSIK